MRLLCDVDTGLCVPFRITDAAGAEGAFLGGRPPQGIGVNRRDLRYFASVPFASDPFSCVSVFVAGFEDILPARGRLNGPDLLLPLVHRPLPRSEGRGEDASTLSEHSLLLLDASVDWIEDDDGRRVARPNHKIGGAPYLVRENRALVEAVAQARAVGFCLVAQFDFPSGDDAVVSGDWPFGDGMFALLGREPFGEGDWLWYWDF